MSGNAVARKLLANAARCGLQPAVTQTASKKTAAAANGRSLLVLQQTKVASPTKRLFSSPPPPPATAPKGGNTAGRVGGGGATSLLAGHHPYHHYWHHHHHRRHRRGFRFGRFVALGTFGFLSYRAMVGPPILQLQQQYDDENNDDDEDPTTSNNKKERRSYHRWRWCHAKHRGSKKETEIEQEVMPRQEQAVLDPTSRVQYQPRVVQEQHVKNNHILQQRQNNMVTESSEDHDPISMEPNNKKQSTDPIMEPNNKKQSTDPTPTYFESFPMKEMAVAALAMALALTQ